MNNSEHNQNGQIRLHRILHETDKSPNVPETVAKKEKEGKSQGIHWTWSKEGKGDFHMYRPSFQLSVRSYLLSGHLPSIDDVDIEKTHEQWLDPKHGPENEIRLHPTSRVDNLQMKEI